MTSTLIYGAGGLGREVLDYLKKSHRKPAGFIDRRAAEIGSIDGVTVCSIEQATREYSGEKVAVVVALHNFLVSVSEVQANLEAAGFSGIQSLWEFCRNENWMPKSPYWLAPQFDWSPHEADIEKARQLLADERSRSLYDEQLALRKSGNYAGLSSVDFAGQYMPKDLPAYRQPVRLIDCGAFDGDTVRGLLANGYPVEDIVAFEPDPESFAKLSEYLRSVRIGRAVNAGTHDRKTTLRFSDLGTGASHLDENGRISIPVECIDDSCLDYPVTLIKMDVEGAETASLAGACKTLRKHRPDLAISVYHKPDDLWSIPLLIDRLDLGYRYYLRCHGQNGFDTVLYAYSA